MKIMRTMWLAATISSYFCGIFIGDKHEMVFAALVFMAFFTAYDIAIRTNPNDR